MVHTTTDYFKFNYLKGNREVQQKDVDKLKKKVEGVGILQPILVNSNMEVLDGQHRLAVAMELRIPVPYIVVGDLTIEHVITMNQGTKKWTLVDYMNKEIELGNDAYVQFRDITEKYQVNYRVGLTVLALNKSPHKLVELFQRGEMVSVMSWAEYAARLERVAKFAVSKHYSKRNFQRALLSVFEVEGFDYDRMVHKFHKYHRRQDVAKLEGTNMIAFKSWLSNIYNYRVLDKNRLELISAKELLANR